MGIIDYLFKPVEQKQTKAVFAETPKVAEEKDASYGKQNVIPILSPQQSQFQNVLQEIAQQDVITYLVDHYGKSVYSLYDEMMRDADITSAYTQRQSAVFKNNWSITSEDCPENIVQMVNDVVQLSDNFDMGLKYLHKATPKGYSVSEINWQRKGSYIVPMQFCERHPAWFSFNPQGELLYKTSNSLLFQKVPPELLRKFVVHTHDREYGDPRGNPVLVKCYWAWFLKKHTSMHWATLIQKYASPSLLAHTKNWGQKVPGLTINWGEWTANLINKVRDGNNAAVPADNEIKIEPIAPPQLSSHHNMFQSFIQYLNAEMTLAFLGQLLTTSTTGVGSYALGDVHYQVREDIAESDRQELEDTVNKTIIPWICDYNGYPNLQYYPEFKFNRPQEHNPDEVLKYQQAGVQYKLTQLYEWARAEKPEGLDEETLAVPGGSANPFEGVA